MPHSYGYRARTRDMFSRDFRKAGIINLSTYLKPVRVGDLVDIVANSAVQKGMPHKFYHGRTGTVFNVSRRAVGVEVNKLLRGKILRKRINVRVEHVRQSKCRKDFLDRVKRVDALKRDAKAEGRRVPQSAIKRLPRQPAAGKIVKAKSPQGMPVVLYPKPFDEWL
eukprot:CAMPEP_0185577736 /NCGR_PEP_ID=MMETSP0434-20130131/10874_1 /TAXON_ID=626734 ORGANISM="Favella taraikaensis, Strain Fe Narragansett Bay" /NCGR_SAMPLE_ID=MMETSP0434 /ASSEMBLY_ACC=CAM_ASM_000379 /LENGTH=165 /DNA_ID=CAMNT_0028195381 /DNA_START=22 /DNA_END=519 /DNA_ORIENTATION=+